jgi:transcriptional regulator with XRE-family HTH domain
MITLKQLREVAGLSQVEVAYKARISSSRLSLFENNLGSLTAQEQEAVRKGIIAMSEERAALTKQSATRTVSEGAPSRFRTELQESTSRGADRREVASAYKTGDRRLALAMKTIESRPSAKKLFASVKESRGYSDLEAAVFTLGRNYPK